MFDHPYKANTPKKMSQNIKKTNDYNDVVIQGRIVAIKRTPKLTLLSICTGRATKSISYPRAVCYGVAREQAEELKIGDRVLVKGNIQSSIPDDKIKNQKLLSVFAEEVSKPVTTFEEMFGSTIGSQESFVEAKNQYKVSGVVTSSKVGTQNSVYFVVKTVKNGRISFVRSTVYTKNTEQMLEIVKPGNYVLAYGYIDADFRKDKNSEKGEKKNLQHKQYYIAVEVRAL